ncbi:hypothetical protein B0J18DRAFT_422727 [Chaetomium sp. MPI-SDFR-AT-0129]|nr:hypothetical protein B0J18DRAFT_422727 [Chaetomium sp. MPI-SDFR-AT-0129]
MPTGERWSTPLRPTTRGQPRSRRYGTRSARMTSVGWWMLWFAQWRRCRKQTVARLVVRSLAILQTFKDFCADCRCAIARSPRLPGGDLVLSSMSADIGQVTFRPSDLADLNRHVVFCHNDLEPRNIFVRSVAGRCEVAAIIDWEMAGFYPFAYEAGVKDCVLGLSNLSFGWYSLFRERTAHLLPGGECHAKLMQALGIIHDSEKKVMTGNVGMQLQTKWIAREQVSKASDIRRGWMRKEGCKAPQTFTKEDKDKLELEVLKELGYI